MKRWLGVLVLILGVAAPSFAGDFNFKVPENFDFKDSQMYFRDFSGGHQSLMATGACYGPLYQLSMKTAWVADVLSVCGWGNVQLEAASDSQVSASFGISPINFWGLQVGVAYNPVIKTERDKFHERLFWGAGLSITSAVRQIIPALTPPVVP